MEHYNHCVLSNICWHSPCKPKLNLGLRMWQTYIVIPRGCISSYDKLFLSLPINCRGICYSITENFSFISEVEVKLREINSTSNLHWDKVNKVTYCTGKEKRNKQLRAAGKGSAVLQWSKKCRDWEGPTQNITLHFLSYHTVPLKIYQINKNRHFWNNKWRMFWRWVTLCQIENCACQCQNADFCPLGKSERKTLHNDFSTNLAC